MGEHSVGAGESRPLRKRRRGANARRRCSAGRLRQAISFHSIPSSLETDMSSGSAL